MARTHLSAGLALIFRGIERLQKAFPHRRFTIDGRLVGDVGEIIAATEYAITLDNKSRSVHDAITRGGRNVQIKATFKDHLTYGSVPDYYLGLKLYPDGSYEEIYNGPGHYIRERYASRKGCGDKLLSFPISELRKLSAQVARDSRVPRRRRLQQRGRRARIVRREQ